ncbi:MAG TPA: PQQ-binding-like beta-propeller repeat protein [Anaerolineaceae bacterium]|nr:PQQ-binding-like beta-propeller repeat protein [Anaerolineaceae bacterium]
MKPRTILLMAVILIAAFTLGACATGPRVTSVAGLAASDQAAYVSYGQSVIKIDTVKSETVKDVLWRYPEKGNVNVIFHAAPLIDGDKIVIGDFANKLHGLNESDGTEAWQFTGAKGWYQSQVVKDGEVYYTANFDRNVYALNASDYSLKWKYADKFGFLASPIVVDSKLIVSSQDHKVIALDKETGEVRWIAETKGSVVSAPYYIEATKSLIVGDIGNEVVWIDAETGKVKQTFNDNGSMSAVWASPVKSGDQIVVTDDKGVIYLFNNEGDLVSKVASAGLMLAGALPVENGFVTVTSEGTLRFVKNGESVASWTQLVKGAADAKVELNTTPVLSGKTIVIAGLANNHTTLMVWGYDLTGNLLWSFPPEKK